MQFKKKLSLFIMLFIFSSINGSRLISLLKNPTIHQAARKTAEEATQKIFETLRKGDKVGYINEKGVSQLGHGLRAAQKALEHFNIIGPERILLNEYKLFENNTNKSCSVTIPEQVIAALCHDIGHLVDENAPQMGNDGTQNHEKIGALFLRNLGASKNLTDLIEAHADAKRYLASVNNNYFLSLSPASQRTFNHQGGFMSKEKIQLFANSSNAREKLLLRCWDDAAKDPDDFFKPLAFYKEPIFYYFCQRFIKNPLLMNNRDIH
jgi:predicted HD phosphohydrolase